MHKKTRCLLFAVALCGMLSTYGQKIHYSRQTFNMPYADAMQLVANVNGNHHLICFNANKFPVIYLYDAQLQLKGKHEIEIKVKENSDIRIVPFKDYYLLYVHLPGSPQHELFKIDGEGNATMLSGVFQKIVHDELNNSLSTLQVVNHQGKLYAVAQTYYDGIKKIGATVIELNDQLHMASRRKVLYNFNKAEDVLQHAMLVENSLLVLKTSQNDEKGNSLDVIKVDLSTGQSLINSFNSGSHLYTNPSFRYVANDSSVLVYSTIREPLRTAKLERTVFISRLNHLLEETVRPGLFRSSFRNNTSTNFLLLQGSPGWLNLNASLRIRTNARTPAAQNFEIQSDPSTFNIHNQSPISSTYFAEYNQPTAIRFTVLDKDFNKIEDSLVANDKKVFDVQPQPFAQFIINNRACLFLIQNFSSSNRGILMLSNKENGQLSTTDIRVFDKYDYLLQQLQAVDNKYVILPYSHKSDIGLVKIAFN